jgi:hypothetical protein
MRDDVITSKAFLIKRTGVILARDVAILIGKRTCDMTLVRIFLERLIALF